jgi:hypothetical protein
MGHGERARPHVAGPVSTPSWVNYAGNQEVFARNVARPRTLDELQAVIRAVSARRGRVRPVATGLSFSDILQTDDTLLILTDLATEKEPKGLLPLEEALWDNPVPAEARVRVIAGARIRELNAALDRAGLAFENLGGFDGQTLIGAISTSTHGSGAALGPLPNAVRSLDLASASGALYRIEPKNGITNPTKFARRYGSVMHLVQDDDWFRACVVSLGCMGVVYSATVAVRSAYRLIEHKRLDTWSNVRRLLENRVYEGFRHYEVYVNPYRRRDHEYTCLVVERRLATPGTKRIPTSASTLATEDQVFLPSSQRGLVRLMDGDQRLIPTILEFGLEQLVTGPKGHIDDSFVVFNVGKINTAKVLSAEYFLSIEDNAFISAMEQLIAVVADNRRHGVYQTAPLSLRFMAPSDAFLSMANGRRTASIETAMFTHARGAREAILSYEQALYGLGARPHWGQIHELTGSCGWLRSAYGSAADRWLAVHAQLDPNGTFDNAFTDRLGISKGRTPRCP